MAESGSTSSAAASANNDDNDNTPPTSSSSANGAASSGAAAASAAAYEVLDDPVQGDSDWRKYRAIRISDNGVTLLLVNDKESKTTSAAATVTAGAAADPRSLPGLAHFCEHMCFLGSEAYPGENEYKQYLSQHGGRSNASTSLHFTTYKFEVLAPHAEKALDMFTQFFVSPLFTASGTEREVNAVDSENSKNLVSDVRRRLQILKDLCDDDHYYTKFTTGHASTLKCTTEEEVQHTRQALLDFHAKHYTPDRLTVVVAGPQSLDELQGWMLPRLAPMKAKPGWDDGGGGNNGLTETQRLIEDASRDAPPIGFHEPAPPYNPALIPNSSSSSRKSLKWPYLLTTKPVRAVRQLEMLFPVPSVEKVPNQSPTSILSHLLGHEGPNSPFAVLQTAGLITSLSAGMRTSAPDFGLFHIQMNLTEQGEKEWRQVADVIFQHARLVHSTAVLAAAADNKKDNESLAELRRMWDESCQLDRIMFHTTSPGSVYDLAPFLCRRLVMYGPQDCLSAGSRLKPESLPLDALVDFSSRLVPSNCLIERCSPTAWEEMEQQNKKKQEEKEDGDDAATVEMRKEPWYGVDYYVSSLSDEDAERWQGKKGTAPFFDASSMLKLPHPNRYIPRTLELCDELPEEAKKGPRIDKDIDPPELVRDAPRCRLWHRLDDRYALPKAVVTLLIRNAAVDNVLNSETGLWEHSTEASVHSSLLTEMFSQAQAINTYDADLAGLRWNLSLSSTGIKLSCSGFNDRLDDLAMQLLRDFLDGDSGYVQEAFFESTKERVVRNLRTFFKARRADSIAMYYRDLLLSAQSDGMDALLKAAEDASLEDVRNHRTRLLQNDQTSIEVLCTGNVSRDDAITFFDAVSKQYLEAFATTSPTAAGDDAPSQPPAEAVWVPGDIERRLEAGKDTEFHFQSDNVQEENGAVLATFQSSVPGFRGIGLSDENSLTSSASIRLLSHILREPLFDELRTKQTLGYIVSSYYDRAIAVRPPAHASLGPMTTPIDSLVVLVLSRKLAPPDITNRVDEFLTSFRETLETMPESQIGHHATALSTKLLKPIQKLGTEASTHFAKLTAFAPEILATAAADDYDNSSSSKKAADMIPWDSVRPLARKIESLTRQDLLETWDGLMKERNRSRIVSCVYGSTFPLDKTKQQQPGYYSINKPWWSLSASRKTVVTNNVADVVALRKTLSAYDDKVPSSWLQQRRRSYHAAAAQHKQPMLVKLPHMFGQQIMFKPTVLVRVAALAFISAGCFAAGWTALSRSRKLTR